MTHDRLYAPVIRKTPPDPVKTDDMTLRERYVVKGAGRAQLGAFPGVTNRKQSRAERDRRNMGVRRFQGTG